MCITDKNKIQNYYANKVYRHRREVVIYLADYKCQLCYKKSINLEVHHIDKNNINNNYDNLICLCSKCHIIIHKCKRK